MKIPNKEFAHLFKKYSAAKCSKQEFNRLLDIIESNEYDAPLYRLLQQQWGARAAATVPIKRWAISTAAAAAVILVFVGLSLFFRVPTPTDNYISSVPQEAILEGVTQVSLPDGSKVMLRDGSHLDILNSFTEDTREIRFDGEAFFDVVSDSLRPFVVWTLNVKTTVLGTAFSIKALPFEKQVLVTVVRGKVQVEDDKKFLAILEAENQLVYSVESNKGTTKTVEAAKEVDWKSHDMIYRDAPFGHITDELTKLYGVTILFDSETLPQRLITGSFDDRDSIERILDILCTSQRAFCVVEEGVYVIRPLKSTP